jgi:hypothetical protein
MRLLRFGNDLWYDVSSVLMIERITGLANPHDMLSEEVEYLEITLQGGTSRRVRADSLEGLDVLHSLEGVPTLYETAIL